MLVALPAFSLFYFKIFHCTQWLLCSICFNMSYLFLYSVFMYFVRFSQQNHRFLKQQQPANLCSVYAVRLRGDRNRIFVCQIRLRLQMVEEELASVSFLSCGRKYFPFQFTVNSDQTLQTDRCRDWADRESSFPPSHHMSYDGALLLLAAPSIRPTVRKRPPI